MIGRECLQRLNEIIAASEERVEAQRKRVDSLDLDGDAIERSERLLATMEAHIVTLRRVKARIDNLVPGG